MFMWFYDLNIFHHCKNNFLTALLDLVCESFFKTIEWSMFMQFIIE